MSCNKALLSFMPVDDLPEVLEVLGACIPIVDIVSVLPDIAVNDRDKRRTLLLDVGLV